jgi:hypothetical protein
MKMRYLKGWTSYNESADANKFQYMMLGRLQTDCDYFLGNGNRSENNLWASTVEEHIAEMKKIWNELEVKPEWLTMEDIENYERQMLGDDSSSTSPVDEEAFQAWWTNGGQAIAENKYTEELEQKFTDQAFVDEKTALYYGEESVGNKEAEGNTFWYVMEEMAKADNLHLN